MLIGFHASHEQMPPSALLAAVVRAEAAGFDAAMCSDHWAPWSERQGHSGFALSWLGAALHATSLPLGLVNAPGQRYHPAIVAQALSTLAEMFPGRVWAALGSGEALNEHITGDRWPTKAERDARLLECVAVMRALFAGEEVSHDGLVRVDRAKLWTRPAEPPRLLGAAVSERTAGVVGTWADGLITVNQPIETLRRVIGAYRDAAGARGFVAVQAHVAWAPSDDEAMAIAFDQWRSNVGDGSLNWELAMPQQFDAVATFVRPEDLHDTVLISADPAWHVDRLAEIAALDVDALYLHHVGQAQDAFIDTFAAEVLPALRSAA